MTYDSCIHRLFCIPATVAGIDSSEFDIVDCGEKLNFYKYIVKIGL